MAGATIDAKVRALNTTLDKAVMAAKRTVKTNWQGCAAKKTQMTAKGTYAWMEALPVIGVRLANGYREVGVASQAIEVNSEDQGLVLKIKKQDIRDDKYGVFDDAVPALSRGIVEFPQKQLWALFKEGDQTTYLGRSILAYDGLAFFHDSHLVNGRDSSGGTYDNNITSLALNKANFETALATFSQLPDEQGQVLNQQATHLIIPPQLSVTAADVLMAQTISTGGTNTSSNEMLAARGKQKVEIIEVPELSGDSTTWYLTNMQEGGAPMIYQETEALTVVPLIDARDLNVVRDKLYVWYVTGEAGFAFANPRRALRCIA